MRPRVFNLLFCSLLVSSIFIKVAVAVECKDIVINDINYTECRVAVDRERLLLLLNDSTGQPFHTFAAVNDWLGQQNKALQFAMNAGMFHPDFKPVGLFVADAKEQSPLNQAPGHGNFFMQPNGVFVVTERGAQIVSSNEYSLQKLTARLATQSGPLLVHKGQINTAFGAQSKSRYIRNGVCAPSPHQAAFVISNSPVTLYEFGLLFRDTLKCKEALYLDGSVSGLYSKQLQRHDLVNLGPIFAVAAEIDSKH
jgi:uncharacterized protein YigE (DUF2233 family)